MKKIIATILLFSLWTAGADVIIYKQKLKATKTGGGSVVKSTIGGFYVIDGQTGDFYDVEVYEGRNRFSVYYLTPETQILSLSTGAGKQTSVLSFILGTWAQSAKGNAVSVNIGAPTIYNIPKSAKVSGTWAYTDNDDFFEEYKGTLSYDPINTEDANRKQLSVEQTIDQISAFLTAQGLVEE